MIVKNIMYEDFVNYKKPSMYIIFPKCDFKCDRESGCKICQNSALAREPDVMVSKEDVIKRYLDNPITSAIVCAGLEPFDSETDLLSFVDCVRNKFQCDDDIVIYTGYTEYELENGERPGHEPSGTLKSIYESLKGYKNIVVKFGRFVPGCDGHVDEVLGVRLASPNQYAKRIGRE